MTKDSKRIAEEDTLSWTYSGESVLKLNIRHLWLFGIWQLGNSRLFILQSAVSFLLCVWDAVECVTAVFFTWGDMEQTTLVLLITFTCGSGVVKMFIFVYDRRRYASLARRLDSLMSLQSSACSEQPSLAAISDWSRRRAGRLSRCLLAFMLSQSLLWNLVPLVAAPQERLLPYVQHAWDGNRLFALSYTSQCLSAVWVSQSEDISAVFKCVFFLPIPGAQVYLYCWAANNVTVQAEAVSVAAYSCSWVEASERFKHALRVIISRSQKPLVLTAGHLYPIDREAFLAMVNASYSYYALLSQMNSRQN